MATITNRFDSTGNLCDGCRWKDEITAEQFPCSHCTENATHQEDGKP